MPRKISPVLSVVIPVYNVQDYLDRCVQSVKKQSYKNMEIILVDDGSTDQSGKYCDQYAAEDARIRVIHKENGGLVSARKAGLAVAKGNYISIVDSDDWLEAGMYEKLMTLIENTQADVVTSGYIRDYGTHCIEHKESIAAGVYEGEEKIKHICSRMISTETFFESRIAMSLCGKIFKKELVSACYSKVDDYIKVGEDAACVYPCLLAADKIVVSGMEFYHYCMRADSIMGSSREFEWERYLALFQILEKECGKYIQKVPNILRQIRIFESYILLLKYPEKIISYENEVLVPFGKIMPSDRIVVYGAGRFGRRLKTLLEKKYRWKITAWIDKTTGDGIQPIECLDSIVYDKIIIAVLVEQAAAELREELAAKKIEKEKILFVNLERMKL
ncbi:MAG: glycosyltransferase [Eubacterium sp.]|nr:glycosyltransferase [Eubacterium sp.]